MRHRPLDSQTSMALFFAIVLVSQARVAGGVVLWDFSSPAGYQFDPERIDISGGEARLRAAPDWIVSGTPFRRRLDVFTPANVPGTRALQIESVLHPAGFDFARIACDGRDLTFTDDAGNTVPHWIEMLDPEDEGAFVTVGLAAEAEGSWGSMQLYYGDTTRVASSSWESTFLDVLPDPSTTSVSPAVEFEAFPALERMPDGDLVVAYRTGPSHLSREGAIAVARSQDGGETWTNTIVYDDPRVDDRVNLGMKCLEDGTLLLPFFQYIGAPIGCFIMRSSDGGRTWSEPYPVANPLHGWMALYGQIVEMQDGTLLMPAYGDDPPFEQTRAVILQSTDQGWNWTPRSVIGSLDVSYTETSIAFLEGQKMLAILRDGQANEVLHRSVSHDAGLTWSEPVPMFDGVSPNLIRLASKRLLLGSSDRIGFTGVRVSSSTDGGFTWDRAALVDESRETDLGYPALIETSPGTILMLHYTRLGGIRQTVFSEDYIALNPNLHNFFEGMEDTESLFDWQIWRLSGWPLLVGQTADCRTGAHALFLDDSRDGSSPYAIRTLYDFGRPEGRLAFWLRADSLVNGFEFALLSGTDALSAESRFRFRVTPEGSLDAHIEDGGVPCSRWAPLMGRDAIRIGRWTKIGIHFHAEEDEAEIRIDGAYQGRARPCAPGGEVTHLGFFADAGAGWGDRLVIDDLYGGRCGPEIEPPGVGPEETLYSADGPSLVAPEQPLPEGASPISFTEVASCNGSSIRYQLTSDGGETWLWWDGGAWSPAVAGAAHANAADTVDAHIGALPCGEREMSFRAFFLSDGAQSVVLDRVEIGTDAPPLATLGGGRAPFSWRFAGPNPVRGAAAFDVSLPESREVSIEIFDVSGRRVRALGARLAAGPHRLAWDGADDAGRPVGGGAYFYVIDALPDRARGRLLVVR